MDALRQFFLGLDEIKNEIDFALEKDRVSAFPGTRACGMPEFMELLGNSNILENVSVSMQPIGDICRQTVIDARTGISEDTVAARLAAVREHVSIILRARSEIRDRQLEAPYHELKRAVMDLLNKTLSEISVFFGKLAALLKIDEKDVPEDKHIRIDFIPDVEKEGAACLREIEKSGKMFKKEGPQKS